MPGCLKPVPDAVGHGYRGGVCAMLAGHQGRCGQDGKVSWATTGDGSMPDPHEEAKRGMAKPGQGAADEMARLAAMSRRAADIPVAAPAEVVARIMPRAEGQLGMRCGGCEQRIGVGFQFTRIEVVMQEGKPTVDVTKLSACNGENGCDFAMEARAGATVMEMVEFVWLDEEPAKQSKTQTHEPDPKLAREVREPAPEAADAPRGVAVTASRLCSECGKSYPYPLEDEEAWGTTVDGALFACPACAPAPTEDVAAG